ncbi:hypothetical protein BB561_002213 [Smittium simulii]|uniref:MATH domain-containing protein n=1 Tax=Smittium simulii TaxID=133385 RepID=A0A2T9YR97_9FUNG|nr:hypothetical protein BB561_002213 [Smittium simulii]
MSDNKAKFNNAASPSYPENSEIQRYIERLKQLQELRRIADNEQLSIHDMFKAYPNLALQQEQSPQNYVSQFIQNQDFSSQNHLSKPSSLPPSNSIQQNAPQQLSAPTQQLQPRPSEYPDIKQDPYLLNRIPNINPENHTLYSLPQSQQYYQPNFPYTPQDSATQPFVTKSEFTTLQNSVNQIADLLTQQLSFSQTPSIRSKPSVSIPPTIQQLTSAMNLTSSGSTYPPPFSSPNQIPPSNFLSKKPSQQDHLPIYHFNPSSLPPIPSSNPNSSQNVTQSSNLTLVQAPPQNQIPPSNSNTISSQNLQSSKYYNPKNRPSTTPPENFNKSPVIQESNLLDQHDSEKLDQDDSRISVFDDLKYADTHMDDFVTEFKAFHWKISNWDALEKRVTSDVFTCGGNTWRILLRPFGSSHTEIVSLFLEYANAKEEPDGWFAISQFVLSIANVHDPTINTQGSAFHCFNKNDPNWGFTRFMKLSELVNPAAGEDLPIIQNGECVISAFVKTIKPPTGMPQSLKSTKSPTIKEKLQNLNVIN